MRAIQENEWNDVNNELSFLLYRVTQRVISITAAKLENWVSVIIVDITVSQHVSVPDPHHPPPRPLPPQTIHRYYYAICNINCVRRESDQIKGRNVPLPSTM